MDKLNTIRVETSSDKFIDMSRYAQVLYYSMALNSTGFGQVYNAKALARALDLIDGNQAINELVINGFITPNAKDDASFYNIVALSE